MSIAGENKEVDEILYTLCQHNVSIIRPSTCRKMLQEFG